MGLSSKLFKNDAKLEACQVNDAAHLTLGAKGGHVSKVQMALYALDQLPIDPNELRTQTYGPSTAKAVLAYKTKRQIINPAYQNAADDIVGKMTITRLDQDLCVRQLVPIPKGDCKDAPVAPPILRTTSSLAPNRITGAPVGKVPSFGKTLRIYCYITKQAQQDLFPLQAQIAIARETLSFYGLNLSVESGDRASGPAEVLETGQWVIEDDLRDLRTAAEQRRPGIKKLLRVFVIRRSANADIGNTERNVREGAVVYPPFVILNSTITANDNMTLLHEMIHAAQLHATDHDPDPNSVFFSPDPKKPPPKEKMHRSQLKLEHAKQLSEAYYAV